MITRAAIDIAKHFLVKWEGCELTVYNDVAGLPTIGVGHLIKPGEKFDGAITMDEAMAILEADMTEAINCVDQHVDCDLEDAQAAALVCFVFNVGCGAFKGSTMLKMLNGGDIDGASKQFMRWVKAGGKEVKGLVNRRTAERKLFDGVLM